MIDVPHSSAVSKANIAHESMNKQTPSKVIAKQDSYKNVVNNKRFMDNPKLKSYVEIDPFDEGTDHKSISITKSLSL